MTHPIIELMQTQAVQQFTPAPEAQRKRILAELTNNPSYDVTAENQLLQRNQTQTILAEAGFVWMVHPRFVSKFRFAAGVWLRERRYDNDAPVETMSGSAAIWYAGDIPDFAIERMRQVKAFEQFRCVTIHSNEPLPVSRVNLRPIDPVMVAWTGGERRSEHLTIRQRARWQFRRNPFDAYGTLEAHRQTIGVVIAAWDFDKEIELASL